MTVDLRETSADYKAMEDYWTTVSDFSGGVTAMRANGTRYLTQFPNESDSDYLYRQKIAKFTNLFGDIVSNLASKPFAKEVSLVDGAPSAFGPFLENVDRQGNHLHVFSYEAFRRGIEYGIDWILVDHTKLKEGATAADERKMGSGPYWVHVPATAMLAVYSDMVDGVEQIIYAKIKDGVNRPDTTTSIKTDDAIERVRIFQREPIYDDDDNLLGYGPATYAVYESVDGGEWEEVEAGPVTIGVIPLVPVLIGDRVGATWRIKPPLQAVADLQVEHFEQESNLKAAKEVTAFPMFAGQGVTPPDGNKPMSVGPKCALYAPPDGDGNHGEWAILEPSATSLKFLADEIDKIQRQMYELGRQPLIGGTANMTQATALLLSQKATSTAQAWALLLKDALERAFALTALWLGVPEPEVSVHTDFAVELSDGNDLTNLLSMRSNGDLSLVTLYTEMKRRGVLSPEFDPQKESDLLLNEVPQSDPATGLAQ